jgi:hypothetical protein
MFISIPIDFLPDGWENGVDIPSIGNLSLSPAASFDASSFDFILTLLSGVGTGIVANWLYSKLSSSENNVTININGNVINIDKPENIKIQLEAIEANKQNQSDA